ncbi:ead/Ea22-like family protein [Klebsiella variicola]|nr:ead/Ea22-like family protein [Klebsiella variicola]
MTDITELAQSLKAAAIDAKELAIIARYSKGRAAAEKFYALANPNNVIALVEALEKAQAVMNAVVTAAAIRGVRPFDGIDCDPPTLEENAEACGDAMSARIRELEANPPKPHHNGLMQISNELASAKQRIAELERQNSVLADGVIRAEQWLLESRAVKMPKLKMLEDYLAEVAVEERKQILIGVKLEFHRACATAGIKVEAE